MPTAVPDDESAAVSAAATDTHTAAAGPTNARRSVLEVAGYNNEDTGGRRTSCSNEDTDERVAMS